ncbi:FAD binding domain-containing protein [Rubrimonas cliftonensis]|uniref:Carbon-monoxide dehydrogenase medium subunit n=1 Tax=Rubrimonas cliftonensis TaxID=89524 RepID=A0A1H3VJC0_9RHOB|nr:xanthine dehydrogenase family protein subunit M [Rubrimonas cliftonensis]SDZ74771.1 carbon-monoxide dehydrogenase medium subunit [Rubrimonas cliftonensis]
MYAFDYVKPASVADAVKALSAEDAQPISGGQTLIPTLKQRLGQPSALVDLTKIADLVGIEAGSDSVLVKGATTHAAVAAHEGVMQAIPGLAKLAAHIGDPQVRNRGTIGGSVANNDPAACYPAAVLGLGATVLTDRREIAADDYFQGMFTTALEEGEIVTGVRFPIPEKSAYAKFVQPASRFALTGVYAAKLKGGVRVAVTGASESGVFRWAEAEAALASNWSPEAVETLAAPAADGMIGDIHGAPDYRAHLVKVMTKRAVAAA